MKFGMRQISSVILNSREKLEKIIEKMNAIKQTKKWTLVIFYAFLSLKSKKKPKKTSTMCKHFYQKEEGL